MLLRGNVNSGFVGEGGGTVGGERGVGAGGGRTHFSAPGRKGFLKVLVVPFF